MQKDRQPEYLAMVKKWIFEYITVIDICQIRNPILLIMITLLEMSALHFFYINSHFSQLHRFGIFQHYFDNINQHYYHIVPFKTSLYSLITLCYYPSVMAVVLFVKKMGPLKLLIVYIQVAAYFYPLLSIKLAI